jgi:peroxiredoxin Q/BCP
MLKQGDTAPGFKLPNQNNEQVALSDYLGKRLVLYFYPKDFTPGCTEQANAYSGGYDQIEALQAVVVGVSKDSPKSHADFIKKNNLRFTLLSDENLETIKLYGVWKDKKMYGKTFLGVERSTFIIDEKGIIQAVFAKVNPSKDLEAVLDYLNKMQNTSR